MPPKLEKKREAVSRPDNSGIAKLDVDIKFQLLLHPVGESTSLIAVFEWFGVTSDKLERKETGPIELLPRKQSSYSFEKAMDIIRDFCKTICNRRLYLHLVNEDSVVVESLHIDYSVLLTLKDPFLTYSFIVPLKNSELDQLKVVITLSQPLITLQYEQYLCPLVVTIIGAKNLPCDQGKGTLPVYVKYAMFGLEPVSTRGQVGKGKILWNQKHVFLLGFQSTAMLKESLRTQIFKFELHDRDIVYSTKPKEESQILDIKKKIEEEEQKWQALSASQQESRKKGAKKQGKDSKRDEKKVTKKDIKKQPKKKDTKLGDLVFPVQQSNIKTSDYGVAFFHLGDLLNPKARKLKLMSPVVPVQKYQDLEPKCVNLNTTARVALVKAVASSNYFECDTSLVVGFDLSCQISQFQRVKLQTPPSPELKKKDTKTTTMTKIPDAKVQPPKAPQPIPIVKLYERLVFIIQNKNIEMLNRIQNYFYQVNCSALGLPHDSTSLRILSTRTFKEQQLSSCTLDYLCGFEVIDSQSRLFVFEGLADGAIKKVDLLFPRDQQNSQQTKILRNHEIKYHSRMYSSFGLDLKRIRFSSPLSAILIKPNLYIECMTPPQMCKQLNKINNIKRAPSMKLVYSLDLWPKPLALIQAERKFGIPPSHEDFTGLQQQKQTAIVQKQELKQIPPQQKQEVKHPQEPSIKAAQVSHKAIQRNASEKSFVRKQKTYIPSQRFNFKMRKPDNVTYAECMYSNQKKNYIQSQIKDLKRAVSSDRKHLYTYSKEYLSMNVSPFDEQEAKLCQQTRHLKLVGNRPVYRIVPELNAERYAHPKKPDPAKVEDLKHPYFQQQIVREQMTNYYPRQKPIHHAYKKQFNPYLGKMGLFMDCPIEQPVPFQTQQKIKQRMLMRVDPSTEKRLIPQARPTSQQSATPDLFFNPGDKVDFQKLVSRKQSEGLGHTYFDNYQQPQILTRTFLHKPLRSNGL